MIVTYIYSSYSADQIRAQFRCRNLVDAINRTGLHRANSLGMNSFIQNTADAQKVCSESDILVIYRYLYGPILAAVQYWKARDKKVIVDFDQAVNFLTKDQPEYSFWFEGVPLEDHTLGNESLIDPIPLDQFKWGLGMVDAATVPSGRLADDWSQITDIYQVPDYINTYQYPGLNQNLENEVWIGLGSNVNYDGLKKSGLLAALENICQRHARVKLILCNLENHLDVSLDIDPSQLKIYTPRFFEEWVSILLKLDIGLAPTYGNFDLRLGSGRLLEYMISKIPLIASEQPAFQEWSQYGQWVKNTSNDWETAILNTVDQLDVYKNKAAKDPFLFAISKDVSANIDKVIKIYASIINLS